MAMKDKLSDALRELDLSMTPQDRAWPHAMFLLASAIVGCDPQAIADECQMDPVLCGALAERARSQGLWRDGRVVHEQAWHEDGGGVVFWMDVGVLDGDLELVGGDTYQVTPEGRRRVEAMLSSREEG